MRWKGAAKTAATSIEVRGREWVNLRTCDKTAEDRKTTSH